MKLFYLVISIFLQCSSLVLFGQKVQTWHFNLSPQAAKQLYKGVPLDTSMLVASTSSNPLIQHQLTLQNLNEEVQFSLQSKASFTLRAMMLGADLAVQATDNEGKMIKFAKVDLNGIPLTYDLFSNLYRLPNFSPKHGTLSLVLEEHTFYYFLVVNPISPSVRNATQPRAPSEPALRGYIAFCKPVFRHRDTLKAKIYAAQPNRKPYSGKLLLELKSHKIWWDTVVSVERGAFFFELALADTLALDETYTLSAKTVEKKIQQALSHTFHLEDYHLNEVQYNLYTSKDRFHANEKVSLNLVAHSTYHSAIPDAMVKLSCSASPKTGEGAYPIWDYQSKLGETGALELEVPADALPEEASLIKIQAHFSRPGEDLQVKEISFWYDPVAIDLYNEHSKIHVHAYGQPYQLWAEHEWGRQLVYSGTEAQHLRINPIVKAYSTGFEKPEIYLNLNNDQPDALADQLVWTTRNLNKEQSITLHNPLGVSIWYRISHTNGKLIQEGWTKDTLFQWVQQRKKFSDLHLHYQYWWGNKFLTQDRFIPHQKRQLQLEWIAPEQIYPGQNLDLQLRIQDEQGNALSGVDLTAGAINAQFDNELPHSPLTLASDEIRPLAYWKIELQPLKKTWQQPLDYVFYKKLTALHNDPYYLYRYFENGFLSDAIPLDTSSFFQQNAFFAPFVVKQGKIQPVLLVYVNDTLTYFGGSTVGVKYNFHTVPGNKLIRIRTSSGLYTLDSIQLKSGYRTNLLVDALRYQMAQASPGITFTPMPDTLTDAEKELLAKSMLLTDESRETYAWDNAGHFYAGLSHSNKNHLVGPFTRGGQVHYIQPYFRKQVFEFPLKHSIVNTLKTPTPAHFNACNLLASRVPSFFDPCTIPLNELSLEEAFKRSGFSIEKYERKIEIRDYCLQYGANGTLKGRVVDAYQTPLIGVSVWIKGTTLGAVSDVDGNFELERCFANCTVVISYVGYVTCEFKTCLSEKPLFGDIVLKESTELLSEVVVSGLGIQKQFSLMASTSSNRASRATARQKSNNRLNDKTEKAEKSKFEFDSDALLSPITNGIRSHFSDYAFWQPQLISDAKGEAHFSVKFPDNITSWQAFAIGMDQSGAMAWGQKNIAAFKPLQAQLYTPRFLVAGDQVQLNAKVSSLLNTPALIHTYFKQNKAPLQDSNWVASAHTNLTQEVSVPAGVDSLSLEFGLQTGQYIDGEARNLAVLPLGRVRPHGKFIEITRDTLMALPYTPGTRPAILTLEPGGVLKLMLEDIKYLKDYHFGCNEQTSSKLMALLLEKSLRGMRGEIFTDEPDIYKGIGILEERQLETGGWSWWVSGQQRYWTTNYVVRALLRAAQAGYPVKALNKGLLFLKDQLPNMNEEDYLVSMETLSKAGVKTDLSRLTPEPQAVVEQDLLYKKLLRQYLLQAHHLPYSLDTLFKYRQVVPNRPGIYWDGQEIFGFSGYRVADCSTQNTLLAYSILKKAGKEEELRKIRSFFLDNRGFFEGNYRYGGRWNNTMEVAKILETILPDLMAEKKPNLTKGGSNKTVPSHHPVIALSNKALTFKVQQADTFLIQLDKEVSSAYLTYIQYTDEIDSTSKTREAVFNVHSQLTQQYKPVESLKLNEPVNLEVEVQVQKHAQYVMIEIPIPAGCSYLDKKESRSPYEAHREYYADRVVIFCDVLPPLKHRFNVQLVPQFAGKYTLNPVWVEDMYHPLNNGTNQLRKVTIHP